MQKGFVFPLLLDSQHGINLLLYLQSVPLCDGSPGVGQHVWPVSQLRPGAVVTNEDFADGVVLANLVIVQNSYHHLHFLKEDTRMHKCQPTLQVKPWDTQNFLGIWGTKDPFLTTRMRRLRALGYGDFSLLFIVLACHYRRCNWHTHCHRHLVTFLVTWWGNVSWTSDWLQGHYVTDDPELLILLFLTPKCWDHRMCHHAWWSSLTHTH